MTDQNRRTVVIVGAGHAGGRFALHLRASGFKGLIEMIGQEPELPYERPPLSKEFLWTRDRERHAPLAAHSDWMQAAVSLSRDVRAVNLDRRCKAIHLSDGRFVEYDELVVATGAAPRTLSIPGSTGPRVFTLRSVADATALRDRLAATRRVVIVGAGVIGLEVAAAARRRGSEVTVVEAGDRVMARVVPPMVSGWIDALHRAQGVRFLYGTTVDAIEPSPSGALRVTIRTSKGAQDELSADVVLLAIGAVPCTQWLEGSGLPISEGMLVDGYCRSPADESCYAIGDVASTWHPLYGRHVRQETWRNAENQARTAAEILCGRTEPYIEIPWMWSDQYDANIQMLGLPDQADQYVLRGEERAGAFAWLGVKDDTLVSAALINRPRDRRPLEALIASRTHVDAVGLADSLQPLQRMSA